MKYCVSARQSDTVLKQADEIMFDYRDREGIEEIAIKNL